MSELRRLRYFLAVADELNFTRAAERLHVAQPALSRQVRLLERELGVQLLLRSTHSVELTGIGELVRERAGAIVGAVDDLWAFTHGHAAGTVGTVVIGHTASIAYGTAPTLIDAVSAALPELDVQGRMSSLDGVLAAVRDGSVAVGLVRSSPADDALEVHPLRRLRQGVLVPTDDPLAGAVSVHVSALAGRPILLHARADNPGHYDDIVALCRDAGFEPTVVARTTAFDPAQSAVRRGTGVAIQAETTDGLQPGDVRWIPFDPPAWLELQLVVAPPPRPAAVDRVIDVIAGVSQARGWLVH